MNPLAPLSPRQWETLVQLLRELSPAQLTWVSGFTAGLSAIPSATSELTTLAPASPASPVMLLFGSQTGNAEKLAREFGSRLEQAGCPARVESMATYKPSQLKRGSELIIFVSTHGEGEPPDNALSFYNYLLSPRAPRLEHLRYAVLALGDSSYEHFCQTGREFDERLAELGAEAILDRIDCDVDYETPSVVWAENLVRALISTTAGNPVAATAGNASSILPPQFTRKQPFPSRLLENLPLTAPGSSKEVRHIVLSLENSGLTYQPGDAVGVIPSNWPERVTQLLETLNLYHADMVTSATGASTTLEKALLHDYEITTLTRPFLENYAALTGAAALQALLKPEQRQTLQEWLHGREIIDVIRQYPVTGLSAHDFIGLLRKLPPRLYSIASSCLADPDEVHLTVAVVRFHAHDVQRYGVTSTYLADRVQDDSTVPIYIQENPNFRLPTDPATPIIMIGPGTGVAPFRAFLQEREATGASGNNWLFFGDRHFENDFLYQTEWLDYRRKGLLTRMDIAFSRDTVEKVYVQHRIREQARDLFAWLEEGAHLYVCGDAKHMATDVHAALLDAIAQASGRTPTQAADYVSRLQTAHRYQRDVY